MTEAEWSELSEMAALPIRSDESPFAGEICDPTTSGDTKYDGSVIEANTHSMFYDYITRDDFEVKGTLTSKMNDEATMYLVYFWKVRSDI